MRAVKIEAAHYEKSVDSTTVQCRLCPNLCVIKDGAAGTCRIRSNRGGTLWADGYGRAVTLAIDPVEKKPLYNFYPGRNILSTGPNGCNFRCGYCQNMEISQGTVPTRYVSPESMAELAGEQSSIGVAYTYTEPFIWFEYIRDAGEAVHDRGLMNVLVSNGYVNDEPLRDLLPVIDAMNIDIKSMRPDFYRKVCGGALEDVLRTVETAAGQCHIELTNLVITNYNDTLDDFRKLIDWVASVDPAIPLHFSRYFPQGSFNEPPTSPDTLLTAYTMAREKLRYVYLGNIREPGTSDTYCPNCGAKLIERSAYTIETTGIENGMCSSCGTEVDIAGVS